MACPPRVLPGAAGAPVLLLLVLPEAADAHAAAQHPMLTLAGGAAVGAAAGDKAAGVAAAAVVAEMPLLARQLPGRQASECGVPSVAADSIGHSSLLSSLIGSSGRVFESC